MDHLFYLICLLSVNDKLLYFIRVQNLARYEEEFSITLSFLLSTTTLPTGYTF